MEPPELTNFGSLVRFALDLEETAARMYDGLVEAGSQDSVAGLATELAAQHRDRRGRLERIRQQVNEMTLEPIADLDGRRYGFDTSGKVPSVALGVGLEETAVRFYSDASVAGTAVLAESARAFRKLAEESARNAVRLRMAPSA